MKWILDLLTKLRDSRWYGKITIHFEAGTITFIRKEETLKPPKE